MQQLDPSIERDNLPRFPHARKGHVESWFVRANHPSRPLAVWLKITVLIPLKGQAVADVWATTFNGESGVRFAAKTTRRLRPADFVGGLKIEVAGCFLHLHAGGGEARGRVDSGDEFVTWDLRWTRAEMGQPMCLLPTRRMIEWPFPKSKLLTPTPLAHFSGTMSWSGEPVDAGGWWGMQGHNWFVEHSPGYCWGQCVFLGADGQPVAVAEGFSGQIRVAGVKSPVMSALVVRRGGRTYRFDRLVDLWRQDAHRDDLTWVLRVSGRHGDAMIRMTAEASNMVCLGYANPDRSIAHCLNSKLAQVVLRVNPVNEEGFECVSEHGGALEFLQPQGDSRLPVVV
ncbi:MAG: hypothetical protein ACI9MC_000778 [Kiritimatiellia bacterium]|jgi:hypothetical protein